MASSQFSTIFWDFLAVFAKYLTSTRSCSVATEKIASILVSAQVTMFRMLLKQLLIPRMRHNFGTEFTHYFCTVRVESGIRFGLCRTRNPLSVSRRICPGASLLCVTTLSGGHQYLAKCHLFLRRAIVCFILSTISLRFSLKLRSAMLNIPGMSKNLTCFHDPHIKTQNITFSFFFRPLRSSSTTHGIFNV